MKTILLKQSAILVLAIFAIQNWYIYSFWYCIQYFPQFIFIHLLTPPSLCILINLHIEFEYTMPASS